MMARIREQPVDWQELYARSPTNLWEQKPHEYSVYASEIVGQGRAMDLGCGEGSDALYFAQQGFDVTAVDISQTALEGLEEEAKRRHMAVTTVADDVNTYEIPRPQHIISSYGVLHFLGAHFREKMQHIQEQTITNGVNSLYVFGDAGDFYDIAGHAYWFPSKDELLELYSGWSIHRQEEKTVELLIKGDNGEILHNTLIKLLAQKDLN